MKDFAKTGRKGFSLVETVIAALLLSGAVVTICTLSTRSLTAVKTNREYESAWEILDRQLTLIDCIGIEEFIEAGRMSGQFGDKESGQMVHYWEVETEEGSADYLYKVYISVWWGAGGSGGKVSASTVLNGTGSLVLSSETEDSEG